MLAKRLIRISVLSVFALIAAAGIAWYQVNNAEGPTTQYVPPVSGAEVGGPFTLLDHTGQEVTDETFHGQYTLVYFGFTFCPDVCPTELWTMTQAIELLGEDGDQVAPLFITVDPERDTVEAMASYVTLFHPRMVGLTGSMEQVGEAARVYRVYYAKVEGEDPDHYLMDHSAFVYLMGPDGRNLILFGSGTSPERMAETIREALGDARVETSGLPAVRG